MTHLHISVPAITRGTLTLPHELKRANLAPKVGFGPFRALSCSVLTLHCLGLICLFIRRNETQKPLWRAVRIVELPLFMVAVKINFL